MNSHPLISPVSALPQPMSSRCSVVRPRKRWGGRGQGSEGTEVACGQKSKNVFQLLPEPHLLEPVALYSVPPLFFWLGEEGTERHRLVVMPSWPISNWAVSATPVGVSLGVWLLVRDYLNHLKQPLKVNLWWTPFHQIPSKTPRNATQNSVRGIA